MDIVKSMVNQKKLMVRRLKQLQLLRIQSNEAHRQMQKQQFYGCFLIKKTDSRPFTQTCSFLRTKSEDSD